MNAKKKNETPREGAAQQTASPAQAQGAQATAGPWVREGDHIIGGRYVCELADWHITAAGGSYDAINARLTAERDANARLIAAAPQLLAALERIERWASGYGTATQSDMREVARAAITSATGGAK